MRIGVIGCGYVFDQYMTTFARHEGIQLAGVSDLDVGRARIVGDYYDLPVYSSNEELLADESIDIVANLTSIESHFEVSRAALEAGKHLYSEKPMTMTMEEARTLAALATRKGVRLSSAPSNVLSSTVQTLWKAVVDGCIGDVRMVYAEFDDNPVYLLEPEKWRSQSRAPWPYRHEYEMGCTWEHVGYHLTWMCAIFGPVKQVTAFSKATLPDKSDQGLGSPTPDFSVASLDFDSGVVGRVTCSIAAPTDHRMRIIGNRGVLSADTYRDYLAPVYLEPYASRTLKARNLRVIRDHPQIGRLLGIGGRKLPLAATPPPGSSRIEKTQGTFFQRWKASQRGEQDKSIGLAELADAVRTKRPHFPPPDFTLHVTELTLKIQDAGPAGASHQLETTFEPLSLPQRTAAVAPNYTEFRRPSLLPRLLGVRPI